MSSKGSKDGAQPKLIASLPASLLARIHTALSLSSFLVCLAIGLALHYERIVKNQWYGWPEEWAPSVSATIGDWYPERNVFQLLIAVTSGPRFALVTTSYLLSRRPSSSVPGFVALCGLLRTVACGGWVFVTSSDDGDAHDVAMISYIVLNIPWMVGTTLLTDSVSNQRARTLRAIVGAAFFATLGPLVYYYIQHKVHRVAGAYSVYALFEWSLIFLDVGFDSIAALNLSRLEIRVVDVGAAPSSETYLAPPLAGRERLGSFKVERVLARWAAATSESRSFLSETYLALVFWTNITALPPMIFYSAVWSMGLSGEEVLLFLSLSPVLLSIKRVRTFVTGHPWLMQALIFGGNAAYKIDDQGAVRLRVVASAVGAGCLFHSARWWEARKQPEELSSRVGIFILGLLISVLLKFANFSLNPFWPIMGDAERSDGRMKTGGFNTWGLGFGALALLDLATRSNRALASPDTQRSSSPTDKLSTPAETPTPSTLSFLAASTGFGSLFFLIHWVFIDSGTIIAWSWQGYLAGHPRGPTAMPHGAIMLAAMSLGAGVSHQRGLVTSREWLIMALAGSWILYATKGWPAFGGGAVMGIFALSVFSSFVESIIRHSPGSSFFLAFLTYSILELASVWTVAYAFVPAGDVLRERTDVVLFAAMALVAAGFANLDRTTSAARLVPVFAVAKRIQASLVLILVLSVAVIYYRRRLEPPSPYHPDIITASIWTVHFALDGRMWESQRRMADIIRDAQIDIIGLLESDVHRIVGGNRDITQYISSTLNMYADIGPSPSDNTWGCALLSKYPIINSTHHLLPSPAGELAPAIHATLDIRGTFVDVIVAHNGQEEDPLDRELQSIELARIMREAYPRPVIFLGYVVTKPHAERPSPYKLLVEDGLMLDVDPADDDRWCEYVLYRGLNRVAYARINRGSNPSITDTELQLAKFTIPPPAPPKIDGPFIVDLSEGNRVPEELIQEDYRFPAMFKGEGVRGHYFQVLKDGTGEHNALYYLDPVEAERRAMVGAKAKVQECTQQ